ncbi:MAG: hypothetical protein WCT20_02160 [Candidatus Babeliales bacterium]|jgi:hypothetical protein
MKYKSLFIAVAIFYSLSSALFCSMTYSNMVFKKKIETQLINLNNKIITLIRTIELKSIIQPDNKVFQKFLAEIDGFAAKLDELEEINRKNKFNFDNLIRRVDEGIQYVFCKIEITLKNQYQNTQQQCFSERTSPSPSNSSSSETEPLYPQRQNTANTPESETTSFAESLDLCKNAIRDLINYYCCCRRSKSS